MALSYLSEMFISTLRYKQDISP